MNLNLHAITYEMSDLKILYAQDAHSEFLSHAHDIRPTFRNKDWQDMVIQMAISHAKFLVEKNQYSQESLKKFLKLSDWATLKQNEFFIEHRNKYLIKYLYSCSEGNSICLNLADAMFELKNPPEFSFELVKAVQKFSPSNEKIKNYLRPLLTHKISEFYCGKAPLDKIIAEQMITAFLQQQAELEIHPLCLKGMKNKLLENIRTNNRLAQISYELLKKSKLMDNKHEKLFLITNFLSKNKTKYIELSLKTLKDISKDYAKREKLIGSLEKIDPLPDSFLHLGKSISKARIRVMSRTFPEYFDLYANTCLDYLEGNKSFSNGNPTPNCHNFFEIYQNDPKASLTKKERYRKATKFLK